MKLEHDRVQKVKEETFEELRDSETLAGDHEGNIEVGGERFNIMGADYFMSDILEMVFDVYGDGAAAILNLTGQGYGEDLYEFQNGGDPQEGFGEFLGLLKFLGYSDITFKDGDIVVSSSPTAVEYSEAYDNERKTCYFLSGMFEGALEEAFGEKPVVKETECRAEGHEECRFEIVSDE